MGSPDFSVAEQAVIDSLGEYGVEPHLSDLQDALVEGALTCHMADTLSVASKLGFDPHFLMNLARRIHYADLATPGSDLEPTFGDEDADHIGEHRPQRG